ncbi:MAG: MMPL family transporter, partial [Deltaproteobacteria bacterium]|nr:MMPL family transporter [Deltaproteobacteria bacterium]
RWLDPAQKLPRAEIAERFKQFEDGFLMDGATRRKLTLNVRPAGTSLGVVEARALLEQIQGVVAKHQAELDANHLRVGYGGSTVIFLSEYSAITGDVFGTAAVCFSLVILSILLFFRDLRSTSVLGIATLIAVAVTFGLTELVIGYLNTQTAFLGVIVAGTGINYGIIYLACVQQLRKRGRPLVESCLEAAQTTAQATLLASATTSVSFGVLIIAANRGFRHFGFIGGVGMLLCWLATFTLVPALLTLWERVFPFKVRGGPAPEQVAVPGFVRGLFARPAAILGAFALLTVASGVLFVRYLPQAMERNLDNLGNDPVKGNEQVHKDNDAGQNAVGKSIAGTLALLDSREEADAFCDAMRERMKDQSPHAGAPPNDKLIEGCETISAVVPRFQAEKLALIK